jgi:2-keto-4-pentenoate hydratase/2-oxohepta-3-ene-1,7-dioic acid hydratase in catechol pathway
MKLLRYGPLGRERPGPIGPWLVTADEIPDPHPLRLWLEMSEQQQSTVAA